MGSVPLEILSVSSSGSSAGSERVSVSRWAPVRLLAVEFVAGGPGAVRIGWCVLRFSERRSSASPGGVFGLKLN